MSKPPGRADALVERLTTISGKADYDRGLRCLRADCDILGVSGPALERALLGLGRLYAAFPMVVTLMRPRDCHNNTRELVSADASLEHVIGAALMRATRLNDRRQVWLWFLHSWAADRWGHIHETTEWDQPISAYYGVPLAAVETRGPGESDTTKDVRPDADGPRVGPRREGVSTFAAGPGGPGRRVR